jgi:hypothetical protein
MDTLHPSHHEFTLLVIIPSLPVLPELTLPLTPTTRSKGERPAASRASSEAPRRSSSLAASYLRAGTHAHTRVKHTHTHTHGQGLGS